MLKFRKVRTQDIVHIYLWTYLLGVWPLYAFRFFDQIRWAVRPEEVFFGPAPFQCGEIRHSGSSPRIDGLALLERSQRRACYDLDEEQLEWWISRFPECVLVKVLISNKKHGTSWQLYIPLSPSKSHYIPLSHHYSSPMISPRYISHVFVGSH